MTDAPGAHPASLSGSLWAVLVPGLLAALGVAALVVGRFGAWLYPEPGEAALVFGFALALGVLLSAAGGAALWGVGWTLARLGRRRPLLVALALVASCSAWIAAGGLALSTRFYIHPLFNAAFALDLVLVVALVRGRHPWRAIDGAVVVGAGIAWLAASIWLRSGFLLGANSETLRQANLALWLAALGLALVLAVASRLVGGGGKGSSGVASRPGLVALVAVAALSVWPLYRAARHASEPPTAESAPAWPAIPGGVASKRDVRDVILISIDTLRADHMGIYGYPRNTTPVIDDFFSDAALFTNAYSQAPWTLPTHASMFTGQFPSTHGVRTGLGDRSGDLWELPEEALTLAEILRNAGYRTAGFTGGAYLSREFGLHQGFDHFQSVPSHRMSEVVTHALGWLARPRVRPRFVFLHAYDVHLYQPRQSWRDLPEPAYTGRLRHVANLQRWVGPSQLWGVTGADLAYLEHLYDSELRGVDAALGRLFEALRSDGALERTAVILTSDHGEEFGEHGRTGHAFALVQELLRVPLLVRLPDAVPQRRVAELAQTVDLAPTILDLVGVSAPAEARLQGVSLLPALRGERLPERPLVFEADAVSVQAGRIEGSTKYVSHGVLANNPLDPAVLRLTLRALVSGERGERLYDLAADPHAVRDLSAQEPDAVRTQRERLHAELAQLRGAAESELRPAPMPSELREELRALGYVEDD